MVPGPLSRHTPVQGRSTRRGRRAGTAGPRMESWPRLVGDRRDACAHLGPRAACQDERARSSDAGAAFDRMPPSHRRRYLAWIGAAKREDTRRRRIELAVEMIGEWGRTA
jgi:hypothetical protein